MGKQDLCSGKLIWREKFREFKVRLILQAHGAVIVCDCKAGQIQRRNPWFDVMKTSAATMAGLLTKLRKSGMKPAGTQKENAREGLMFQG